MENKESQVKKETWKKMKQENETGDERNGEIRKWRTKKAW